MMGLRRPIAATVAVIGVSALTAITAMGASTYAKATRTNDDDGIYAKVQAASYPGSRFVDSMASRTYDGHGMKRVQQSEVPLIPERCGGEDSPDRTMLYSRSGHGDGYSITAQAYGAGQARGVYDGLAARVASCMDSSQDSTKGHVRYTAWQGGYLMTAGDTLVSIAIPEQSRQQEIMDGVTGMLEDRLKATGCVSTEESANDAKRSFYYDEQSYKGLTNVEEVSATRKRIDIAIPQNLSDAGGDINALYAKPILRAAPESPLPAGMQGTLPSAPSIPQIPVKDDAPSQENAIEYQVKDTKGPGCGWTWSGQKAPSFNSGVLQSEYRKKRTDSIKAMNGSILDYNAKARIWSMSVLWNMRFINTWNQYLGSVNGIQDQWNRLDAGREAFRPTWMGYIQSVKDWETSRMESQAAAKDRDATVSGCVDSKQNDWMNGNQGKNPDDTQKNAWRQECDAATPKPPVPQQSAEPSAPQVPNDITIPGSWPTKADAISQADATFNANRDALQRQRDADNARRKAQEDALSKEQADKDGGNRPETQPSSPSPSPSPSPSTTQPSSPSSPSVSPSPSPSPSVHDMQAGIGGLIAKQMIRVTGGLLKLI